jgi:hypothetical protein
MTMTAPFATSLLGWKDSGKNKLRWPLVPNFADVDSAESLRIAAGVLDRLVVQRDLASDVPKDPGGPLEEAVCDLTSVEICAGAGGQALGLEQAGFAHEAAVELDSYACETLRRNRGDDWKIIEGDVCAVDGRAFRDVDLFSGGVPCPPFSIAGKQLGSDDDRDLFPQALRLVEEIEPRAVLLENVRGPVRADRDQGAVGVAVPLARALGPVATHRG